MTYISTYGDGGDNTPINGNTLYLGPQVNGRYSNYHVPEGSLADRAISSHNPEQYDVDSLMARIFSAPRFVRTPRKWTFTTKDYEENGIVVIGDEELDSEAMNAWVTTTRTLAELAEWHDEGKEFIIPDPQSQEQIYLDILEYTNFVAASINDSIHLQYAHPERNEKLQEVINDVIKLQNLGNRIFPKVVLNLPPPPVETKGLFGFISKRRARLCDAELEFNPLERYGFRPEDFADEQNYAKEQGTFNAIDIRRQFNPSTLSNIKQII